MTALPELSPLPELLAERYGADAPALPADADNPVLRTLLAHKSVRHYAAAPLPPGTLELLGAAAQSVATSSNLQTWSVVAVSDPERKAEAARLSGDQNFIKQAPLFLVFCADLARLSAASEREGLPGAGLDYLELYQTAVIDAALAAQNAAVAAEGMGLGICYVGGARNHPQELAALLHLPRRVVALFGLTVGVPAAGDTAQIKPRLPQRGLIHTEVYDAGERDAGVSKYNETMRGFYESQGMDVPGSWTQHSAKRVAGPEALSGRGLWHSMLEERGFGLK